MSTIKHTLSQQQAISIRGRDILVSAAAGSGKTRVLIDRIISMICEDHISLRNMLVVTFTNAAAGEMKERLALALKEKLIQYDHRDEYEYIRHQLIDLPIANISTLHSFCSKIIRSYYYKIGIEPNFSIITSQSERKMKHHVMQMVLEDAYKKNNQDFLNLIEGYGGRFEDAGVISMINDLWHTAVSQIDPENWLNELSNKKYDLSQEILEELKKYIKYRSNIMKIALENMDTIAHQDKLLYPYLEVVQSDYSAYQKIIKALISIEKNHIEALEKHEFMRLPRIKKDDQINEFANRFKIIREEQLKKIFFSISHILPSSSHEILQADLQMEAEYLRTLGELTNKFYHLYQEEKKNKNMLDFNDLEHYLLSLLEDDEICLNLQKEIQYVFFDEYQDVNPIQEAIISKLGISGQKFFVGDVKQAIYRFRQADPLIFNTRYEKYNSDESNGKVIHLSENFRSNRNILEFSNSLFKELMSEKLGDVDYLEDGQKLVCGSLEEDDNHHVKIVHVDTKDSNKSNWYLEGLWIAQEIKKLVAEKKKKYSDFAILLRVPSTHIRDYTKALESLDIPYYSDNHTINFQNMEVKLFIDLLQVIDNHLIDDTLLSVLTAPFISFNEEELAIIRISSPHLRFSEAFVAYASSYKDDLAQKIESFLENMEKYRLQLKTRSLVEFSEDLFEDIGFANYLRALKNGEERCKNIYALLDIIAQFDSEDISGLYGFLQYINTIKSSDSSLRPAVALSSEDNCVRIMSIHKSKGLGFDTVFLANMAHKFNFKDLNGMLIRHDRLGVSLDIVDLKTRTKRESLNKKIISSCIKSEILSEEVRLLYVALTRAKKDLYLLGSGKEVAFICDDICEKDDFALLQCNSFWEWLKKLHFSIKDQCEVIEIKGSDLYENEAAEDISIIDLEEDLEILNNLRKTLGTIETAHTPLPYKTTVTELSALKKKAIQKTTQFDTAYGFSIPRPNFLTKEIHHTAAEVGTILHRIIQLIPIDDYNEQRLEYALLQLVEKDLITDEELNAINQRDILNFTKHQIYGELLKNRKSVEREVSFTMIYEEYLIDGQIDLIYQNKKGYHIIDFKSDREINPEKHRFQLELYKEALEKARNITVASLGIYWIRHQHFSEIT